MEYDLDSEELIDSAPTRDSVLPSGHHVRYRLIAIVNEYEVFDMTYGSTDSLIEDISKAEKTVAAQIEEDEELMSEYGDER